MDSILEKLRQITNEENIICNAEMKKHTSFKTGGPADILVTPTSKKELAECLKLDVPKTIIGNGSNMLVKDGGIRGLVIKTSKLNNISLLENNIIEAESGALLGKIAMFAKDNSLKGFEFASGIPGTLGGAVMMNAGAYGGEIKDVVIETEYADSDGNICTITDHEFAYRKSFFTGKNFVILSSKIKLENGNKDEIENKIKELREARTSKQPLNMPSAGSTFKRPQGHFAAKLIEDAGLKGHTIGGAQVSTLHAGFVINTGSATSKDILDLIAYIQKTVKEKFDVALEPEVRIIGED